MSKSKILDDTILPPTDFDPFIDAMISAPGTMSSTTKHLRRTDGNIDVQNLLQARDRTYHFALIVQQPVCY